MNFIKRYLCIYRKMPLPTKAALWYTICSIVQKGISFITVPIFTRLLSTEQYGTFSVYQSVSAILTIFATLSLTSATYNVCVTKYNIKEKDAINSSLIGVTIISSLVCVVTWLFFRSFLYNMTGLNMMYMPIMFVEIFFSAIISIWCVSHRYDFKYKPVIILTLTIAVMNPVTGILMVNLTTYKAEARILSVAIINVIFGIGTLASVLRKNKRIFQLKYVLFSIGFALPLIPHYLSMNILNQADRLMINYYCGGEKAAIYSVAYNVAVIMNFIITAINSSFIPYTYQSMKKNHYSEIKKITKMLLLIVAITSVFVILIGPEIITLMAPAQYSQAIWIIPPVAISTYFMFLYSLYANIEFYFEKNKYATIASCIGALVNIILNYFFIQKFGFIAAGYTTLFCYIMFFLAHYICFKKIVAKNGIVASDLYDQKWINIMSIVVILGSIALTFTYQWSVFRYFLLLVLASIGIIRRKDIISMLETVRRK